MCFLCFSGAFLIPYVISLVIIGLPIFYFELCFGQFSSLGPITIWKVSPISKGKLYAIGVFYIDCIVKLWTANMTINHTFHLSIIVSTLHRANVWIYREIYEGCKMYCINQWVHIWAKFSKRIFFQSQKYEQTFYTRWLQVWLFVCLVCLSLLNKRYDINVGNVRILNFVIVCLFSRPRLCHGLNLVPCGSVLPDHYLLVCLLLHPIHDHWVPLG